MQGDTGDAVSIPGLGRSLGEGNRNPLAWRIPWTEEPSRLQSMRVHRVRHDWARMHTCNCLSRMLQYLVKMWIQKMRILFFLFRPVSKLSVHAAHNNNNTEIFLPSCMHELLWPKFRGKQKSSLASESLRKSSETRVKLFDKIINNQNIISKEQSVILKICKGD